MPRWDLRHGQDAVGIILPPGKTRAGCETSRPCARVCQLAGVTRPIQELPRVMPPGVVDVAVPQLSTSKIRNRQ